MNHTSSTSQNNIAILSTITTTLTIPYQYKNTSFTQSSSRNTSLSVKETATIRASPVVTITRTQFKTSTVSPRPAISSFSLPSFAAVPFYTTTTFITSVTTSPNHDPQSTQLTLFPFDDTRSPWRQFFPALIVFALLGVLSALTCLLLCIFCVYRRYHSQKQQEETTHPAMEETDWHIPAHVDSESAPQFVPIASSPLTLVPRAAIWKDPERRRGVNEMDLWEQKRQQRQSTHHQPPAPPEHTRPWSFPKENEDDDGSRSGSGDDKGKGRHWTDHTMDSADEGSSDSYLDDGRDRPWQRYLQQQQQQVHPVSDLARTITVAALNDDDNEHDDQHSTQTSSFGSVFHSRLDSMDEQTGTAKRPFSR